MHRREWDKYNHGLPFSEGLAKNIDALKQRIKDGKASLLIIDGGIGQGKTTFGVEIGEYYQGKEIIFEEQLAMGGIDFAKKLKKCFEAGHEIIIYDEAGDFSRRGALTRLNATLNRVFETFRVFKILVILILPSFDVLDSQLMDKQIPRFLLHCSDRTVKAGHFRGYSLRKMWYLLARLKKTTVKPASYKLERPNLHGHFLNLSKKRATELDKFSLKGKLDILDLAEIRHDGLLSLQEIANKLNRSKRWVQDQVSKKNLKFVKKYKTVNYYGKSVVPILMAEVK